MPTTTQLARKHVQRQYQYSPLGRRFCTTRENATEIERDPLDWLRALFPTYVSSPFAPRHEEFWQWVWGVRKGQRPRPFVAIWPRGGAKSTSAELAAVALGARKARSYVLYICATQEQADDHVQNIAALLESSTVESYYPELAARMLGKYGASKGWRRNRLRTAAGFTVDALGLDTAARGVKLEEQRPDLMIIDDVDAELDTPAATQKKITVLTKKLLPAGSADVAVMAIQNLIIPDGIFGQLKDNRADFLTDRIVSGPYKAIDDLTYEQQTKNGKVRYVITGGTATWEGQSLSRCQEMIDTSGISSFLHECQQEVEDTGGSMFSHLEFQRCDWHDVPWDTLLDIQVWCDPAVTDTDNSDAHGIQIDALAADGKTIYRLWSWEQRSSPQEVLRLALRKAVELKASCVGVETDQGGDTWQSVYNEAWQSLVNDDDYLEITSDTPRPVFRQEKAGSGHGPKAHRGQLMVTAYEQGVFIHVNGTHNTLERALRRYLVRKPYDLTDAAYWAWQGVKTYVPASSLIAFV